MTIGSFWPNPAWIERVAAEDLATEERRFILRMAALYHNPQGSLQELSLACGYSKNGLHQAAGQKKGVTPECAIKLEALLGREHFPRELFRPDIFSVA